MQALKALVIIMGILIAVGVAVLGVTIYNRATRMVTDDKPTPVASPLRPGAGVAANSPLAPASGFGVRELGLPTGSTIVSVQSLGARVLVQARLPDGGTRILLLDPASGDVAGEWRAPGAGAQAPIPPTPPSPLAPPSPDSGALRP